jgi:carbonic anhydrase
MSGSTLLADDDLRHGFARRLGADEKTLTDTPVLDPARTVRTDVNRLLWAEEVPQNVRVSGHVYDVATGLVTTIVDARARKEQAVTSRFSAV